MKAAGIVNYGTGLDNPDFAEVARAVGLYGARVEKADELEDALADAFTHDGPALVDVVTARQELSLPPTITYSHQGFIPCTRPGRSSPARRRNRRTRPDQPQELDLE